MVGRGRGVVPRGVAHNFVRLLRGDRRASRTRAIVAGVLCGVLAVPAWLFAPPLGVVAHVAAVLVGLIGGLVAGHRIFHIHYNFSIKRRWNHWMQYAVSCESIPEVHRRVRGQSSRNLPYLYAALLTLLWGLEVGLVALALVGETALAFALPVIALNGLLASFILGHAIQAIRWYTSFDRSLNQLVQDGEMPVWGVV